jgi:hypothetical protein
MPASLKPCSGRCRPCACIRAIRDPDRGRQQWPEASAWFDPRKLERALYNLLLNACEAAPSSEGRVQVTIERERVLGHDCGSDNGPGIAEPIRDKLFHPFVSFGKENGTGLGLTVVQKDCAGSRGQVLMERTADARTVFRITIPGRAPQGSDRKAATSHGRSFLPVSNDQNDVKTQFDIRIRSPVFHFLDFTTIRVSRRRMCEEPMDPRASVKCLNGSRPSCPS